MNSMSLRGGWRVLGKMEDEIWLVDEILFDGLSRKSHSHVIIVFLGLVTNKLVVGFSC